MSDPTRDDDLFAASHALSGQRTVTQLWLDKMKAEWQADAIARAEKAEAALLRVKMAAVEVVIEATATDFDPSTREWGELIEALDAALAAPSGDEEARRGR